MIKSENENCDLGHSETLETNPRFWEMGEVGGVMSKEAASRRAGQSGERGLCCAHHLLYFHTIRRARPPCERPGPTQKPSSAGGLVTCRTAAVVPSPLPTSGWPSLPTSQPVTRLAQTNTQEASWVPVLPAAAELTRPHWQAPAPEDNLTQLTMPSRKSPAGRREKTVWLFSPHLWLQIPQSFLPWHLILH